MKAKNIMLLAAMVMALCVTGCKAPEPFETESANDYPVIQYPYDESGSKFSTTISVDEEYIDSVVVTPSKYTTVRWLLDGQCVQVGTHIQKQFMAGVYSLVIEATTDAGLKTSRFGKLTVTPLADNPYSDYVLTDRYVKAGSEVTLAGVNLASVSRVSLRPYNSQYVDESASAPMRMPAGNIDLECTATASSVTFTIPEGTEARMYYVVLLDAESNMYGANHLDVVNKARILGGFETIVAPKGLNLSGVLMDQVASVTLSSSLGTYTISEFKSQSATAISAAMPDEIEAGKYNISATLASGEKAVFVTADGEATEFEANVMASPEVTLKEGNFVIGWNADICRLTKADLADVKVGSAITVYYTIWPAGDANYGGGDEYSASRITNPSWDADFVPQFDLDKEATSFSFEYTADMKARVDAGADMCFVGFGHTITKISYKGEVSEEQVLKEGRVEMGWDAELYKITAEEMAAVKVGSTISVYWESVDMPEGYHALRITTPWWGDNGLDDDLVTQFDLTGDTPQPFTFVYDERCAALVETRGAMCPVGYGYAISKITFQ